MSTDNSRNVKQPEGIVTYNEDGLTIHIPRDDLGDFKIENGSKVYLVPSDNGLVTLQLGRMPTQASIKEATDLAEQYRTTLLELAKR